MMRKKQYQQQLYNQGQNEKKKKRVLSLFGLNNLGEQKKKSFLLLPTIIPDWSSR